MSEDRKDARRRQILDAALQAFSENGFDRTSMEDVRVASGLSKGTLYLYFRSKEALFAGLAQDLLGELIGEQLTTLVADVERPAVERLRQIIRTSLELVVDRADYMGLYMDFFAKSWQHPLIRETLSTEYSGYIDLLADLLQQGVDSGELHPMDTVVTARLLAATLDGLGLQVIVLPDVSADQVVDRMMAVLLADLKAGAAGDLSPPI